MELITVMPSEQLRSTTQSQANVAKTRNALAKSVSVLEHLREGCEEQVDDTVDETHVQRHDDTDGALVEELDGAANDLAHEPGEREGRCTGGLDVGVSGFFAELGGFAVEEDRAVGFTEENEADDGHDTALFGSELNTLSTKTGEAYQNGQQPEDPSPVGGLGEETSSNGTNYGSNQHAQTEDTHDTKPRLAMSMSHKSWSTYSPLSFTGTKSEIVPPPFVKGAPPITPESNRKIRRAVELGESPQQAVKMVKKIFPTL